MMHPQLHRMWMVSMFDAECSTCYGQQKVSSKILTVNVHVLSQHQEVRELAQQDHSPLWEAVL